MRTEPQVAAKAEMLAVLDSPTEDGGAAEAAAGTDGAPAPAALPPASLLLASVGHHQPTYELDDDEDEEGDRLPTTAFQWTWIHRIRHCHR